MSGTVLEFPILESNAEPEFHNMPARTNRRLHISAEEGRRRLLAGTLPPWSVILGNLRFADLDKPIFPANVHVCGSLTLLNCLGMTKLGNGLEIDGEADFTGTPLTKLPRLLRVGGTLCLIGTAVKGVPRDLIVREGVIVDEFASASLRALAGKRPVKWIEPEINF